MFDDSYLDMLDERELLDIYEWCRSRERELRASHAFGLAHWYGGGAIEVCNSLGRYYLATQQPRFSRAQLELDAMPPRVGPELRLV